MQRSLNLCERRGLARLNSPDRCGDNRITTHPHQRTWPVIVPRRPGIGQAGNNGRRTCMRRWRIMSRAPITRYFEDNNAEECGEEEGARSSAAAVIPGARRGYVRSGLQRQRGRRPSPPTFARETPIAVDYRCRGGWANNSQHQRLRHVRSGILGRWTQANAGQVPTEKSLAPPGRVITGGGASASAPPTRACHGEKRGRRKSAIPGIAILDAAQKPAGEKGVGGKAPGGGNATSPIRKVCRPACLRCRGVGLSAAW